MAERRTEHVMGLPVTIDLRDDGAGVAAGALDEAFAWLRVVDARFSPFVAGSDVSRLSRSELTLGEVHPDVRAILRRCEALRRLTGGFFDARAPRPGTIDPSALVKGWAVDRAGALLTTAGAREFCINAGGDLLLRGRPWRVGVQHPTRRDAAAAAFTARDLAVATSGTYERGEHIVDPWTGRPPSGVLSVTITGPDLATADAFATAAFAMGVDGPAWTARLGRGFEAMTILADGSMLSTRGFGRPPTQRSPTVRFTGTFGACHRPPPHRPARPSRAPSGRSPGEGYRAPASSGS